MNKRNTARHSGNKNFTIAVATALLGAAPCMVQATPGDAFNLVVGSTATYDDNLFRLSPGKAIPVAGGTSRSDTIYTAYAGLRLDKAYALQRLQLDLTATRYEYQTYSFLNFSALDYRAAWLWSLTPRLTGIVSAERNEAPTNYADFNSQNRKNVQISETRRVAGDWWLGGAWHLTGGLVQTRLDNSASFTAVGNYVQDTAEAGIRYVSPGENSIAAVRRESLGKYSNRTLGPALLDTEYRQSETEVRALWRLAAHSSLDARLAYLDRSHEHYAQRDYAGATGDLSYRWTPSEKLSLTLATGRNLFSYQETTADYSSSYYVADYVSLTPAWRFSEKTTLRLRLGSSRRDYGGAVAAAANRREDTMRSAQLSLAWHPTQTITIGAYLTHEQRSSNLPGNSYHDNIAGISAALQF